MSAAEITLRVVLVPDMPETIHATSCPDPKQAGRFIVLMNGRDTAERQAEALAHEWQHIINGDHYSEATVEQIEAEQHRQKVTI